MSGNQIFGLAAVLSGVVLQSGCMSPEQAEAQTFERAMSLRLLHSPLQPVEPKRQGTILIRPLTDARKEGQRLFIGEIHHSTGTFIPGGSTLFVARNSGGVTAALNEYLGEVLKEVGYTTSPFPSMIRSEAALKGKAVLEGEITEFWLRPSLTTKHRVRIHLRLLDASGRDGVLWEKELQGAYSKVSGIRNPQHFEGVVQKALDKLLLQAAQEFAAEMFYSKVNRGN